MRNPKLVTLALSATALGGAVLAAPAAVAADTAVTFQLTGGDLVISAPSGSTTPVPLTGAAQLSLTATSVQGALGTTTVTDNRGGLLHSLTVKMAAGDFHQYERDAQGAIVRDDQNQPVVVATIAKSNAQGWSGLATAESLTNLAVPTTEALPVNIGGAQAGTILETASFVGNASLSYDPTVRVNIPVDAPAGVYNGVVTQTVS